MKPVCDHPNYCKNDVNALYIGQSHHIAYRPHRFTDKYFPTGWNKIRQKWDGLCSYTGRHGTGALCNLPSNTHSWQHLSDFADTFMCGRVSSFTAKLGSRNGVPRRRYEFKIVQTDIRSGKFSAAQISECKKFGMKPICDHRSYCRNDKQVLYLGQDHHLAYRPHRLNKGYSPRGLDKIARNWDGLCAYTGRHGPRDHTLCNIPGNTHSWQKLSDRASSFVCGRVLTGESAGKITLFDGKTYKDPLSGWEDSDEITSCGSFGKILGGPNSIGKNDKLKKVYTLPCNRASISITFKFARLDNWNNEEAWFKINGEKQWSKKGHRNQGSNKCGTGHKDELWSVTVKDLGVKGRIVTMEVGTSGLRQRRDQASWGIKDFTVKLVCEGCGVEIERSRNRVRATWAKKHESLRGKVNNCNKQIDARKKQLAHHKKRSEENAARASQCKKAYQGYRKERNDVQRQRDSYRRQRDAYRKKRDGFRTERDSLRAERDKFRRQRDSYKQQREEAKTKSGNARKECESKRQKRDRYWTDRMKNHNTVWGKRIKGLEKNKSVRETEWNRKFERLTKETNDVRKERDDYKTKKTKFSNELKACTEKRRDREKFWRKKYARKERFWERRLKDKRGAASKNKADWERKLDNAKKSMDRRVAACKKERFDRVTACKKDRDNRLKRWQEKYNLREKDWQKQFADLKAENLRKANEIKAQITECKTDRAKEKELCKQRLTKCRAETQSWKDKMNKLKDKAEAAKVSRHAAEAAFKKMAVQVRVMERRARECETKKADRKKYHMKRFHEMKAKHYTAKQKRAACKKAHEHNEYLQRNYKSMFKMVRTHADDLKEQRDKARRKSEKILERLAAYQKKCGDLGVAWKKKMHVMDKREEEAYALKKRAKGKAEILEPQVKELQGKYDELAKKKKESDDSYKAKLKDLRKGLLSDKERIKMRLRRRKSTWKQEAEKIKQRSNEDNEAYKARMAKERKKFEAEEAEIQAKWNKIEAQMKRRKDESEGSFKKRIAKAEAEYHKASRFMNRYKAEKEAHKRDVADLKKKIEESKSKAEEVSQKQEIEIKKAQETLDREQKLRKKADLHADKYTSLAKEASAEQERAEHLLSEEKAAWGRKLKRISDKNMKARNKLLHRAKKYQKQMSEQEREHRLEQKKRDAEWKKRIASEKKTKGGVDVEKLRVKIEKKLKASYKSQINDLTRKQARAKAKAKRGLQKMKDEYDSTKAKFKRQVDRLERKHEAMGDNPNNKKLTKENRVLKRKLTKKCAIHKAAEKKSVAMKKRNVELREKLSKREKKVLSLEKEYRSKQEVWKRKAEAEAQIDSEQIKQLELLIEDLQKQLMQAARSSSGRLTPDQKKQVNKMATTDYESKVTKASNTELGVRDPPPENFLSKSDTESLVTKVSTNHPPEAENSPSKASTANEDKISKIINGGKQ